VTVQGAETTTTYPAGGEADADCPIGSEASPVTAVGGGYIVDSDSDPNSDPAAEGPFTVGADYPYPVQGVGSPGPTPGSRLTQFDWVVSVTPQDPGQTISFHAYAICAS